MNNIELNKATKKLDDAKAAYEKAGKDLAEARKTFDLLLKRATQVCVERFYSLDAYAVAFVNNEEMGGSGPLVKVVVKSDMKDPVTHPFDYNQARMVDLINFDSSVDLRIAYASFPDYEIAFKFLNYTAYIIPTQSRFNELMYRLASLPPTADEVKAMLADCVIYNVS